MESTRNATLPVPTMGELLSLLTALLFGIGVIFYKKSVGTIPPLALNLIKNCLALLLLVATTLFLRQPLVPPVSLRDLTLILLSGAIGIGISDTLFFVALHKLGASRTALVDCLYSPFVIVFSVVLLKETLSLRVAAGGALIIGSVLLSSARSFGASLPRKQFWIGCGFGTAAMATVAFAVVLVKPLLQSYPLSWLSTVRMVGGLATLLLLLPLHPNRQTVYAAFRPQQAWKWVFWGTFFGSYLSLISWLAGFKYAQTGVAALLNQTSTVIIVILAWIFLKEPMTRLKVVGAAMAFAGAALVVS
jgi:drug/metabolite transporter (DMT)-like permease